MLYTISNKLAMKKGWVDKLNDYEGLTIKLLTVEELHELKKTHKNTWVIHVEGKEVWIGDVDFEDVGSGYSKYGLLV